MNQLNLFIEVTRIKRPIGYMLLFWPCAWGLTIGFDFSQEINLYFFYLFLFLLGSILMRSAGCIVNDIVDRKFDKKVFRTKDRPIASGNLSVQLGLTYVIILCLLALFVLINFNYITIFLALGSMPLAFAYPYMKRFTYWPQLFLGITFNYGLILGWTAIKSEIQLAPILFYLGAIFWTLGYDTIYGYQDIKDDEIIGLKSTSIKFKGKAKKFLFVCYTSLIIFFLLGAYSMKFNYNFYLFLILPFIHLFLYQIKIFNLKDPSRCLKAFKSNNFLGLLIFLNILIAKI